MTWNVLTAGPSAGKSSLIRELSARGYETRPEAARLVIDQAISEGEDVAELKSREEFHEMVEARDQQIMANTPTDETVFFDRSIIDNLAYRRLSDNFPAPKIDFQQDRFDTVFLLERVEFQQDEARVDEDAEWAQKIHEELRAVYTDLGFTVIDVELMPVDRRADYVEHVIEYGPPTIH
jgi:predicted ATPase